MSNKNSCSKGIVLTLLFGIFISSLTFAADKDIVAFQGIVMELDWEKRMIAVNERVFTFTHNTVVYNERGSPISQDHLRTRRWVYIEGIRDKNQKRIAKRIYLLPKYIDEEEKHLYPFIK